MEVSLLAGRGTFLVVLCIHSLVASAAAASSRPTACPGAARPVCGRDGFTYYNPCVAAYNGVPLAGYGACPGDPQRFVSAIVGPSTHRQQPQPRQQQGTPAAASTPFLLLPDILDAYKQQGFAYVGRVAMAAQPGMARQANLPPPASAAAMGAAAWFQARRPQGLWATHCTSAGDVYVARYPPPSEAVSQPRSSGVQVVVTEQLAGAAPQQPPPQQQQQETAWRPQRTPAADAAAPPASKSPLAAALRRIWQQQRQQQHRSPPWRAAQAAPATGPQGSSQGSARATPSANKTTTTTSSGSSRRRAVPAQPLPTPSPAHAAAGRPPRPRRPPRTRRLATLLGGDQRAPCTGVPPAVGMLQFSLAATQYVCTGVLFAPRKVLTAGHCVYDAATHTYVTGLTFTPGQALAANGTWLAPYGVLPASGVTVFKNYLSNTSNAAAGDLAVVHLNDSSVASRTGVMPLASNGCGGGPRPLPLTTAGYPVDKPLGGCWEDGCGVTLDCASGVSRHSCDTALGQSGSPLWDAAGNVRAVHVRGDETFNEAITLTEPIVQAINSW